MELKEAEGSVVLDVGSADGVDLTTGEDIYYRRLQPNDMEECMVSAGALFSRRT